MRDVPHPYSGQPFEIVIRKVDHEFWTHCIAELSDPNKRDPVAVVRTPGIGKSTTSFYLIKLLLEMKKTVMYLRCSVKEILHYVELVPSDDGVRVSVFPESANQTQLDTLYDHETYFIIDPGETRTNCNSEGDVPARVVMVASPDERHWGGGAFSKKTDLGKGGMFRYFPPWSFSELLAASREINKNITDDQIAHLYQIFGGIPR